MPKAEIKTTTMIVYHRYKQSAYEEEYPHPLEIITEINELEMEITAGLAELEAVLW